MGEKKTRYTPLHFALCLAFGLLIATGSFICGRWQGEEKYRQLVRRLMNKKINPKLVTEDALPTPLREITITTLDSTETSSTEDYMKSSTSSSSIQEERSLHNKNIETYLSSLPVTLSLTQTSTSDPTTTDKSTTSTPVPTFAVMGSTSADSSTTEAYNLRTDRTNTESGTSSTSSPLASTFGDSSTVGGELSTSTTTESFDSSSSDFNPTGVGQKTTLTPKIQETSTLETSTIESTTETSTHRSLWDHLFGGIFHSCGEEIHTTQSGYSTTPSFAEETFTPEVTTTRNMISSFSLLRNSIIHPFIGNPKLPKIKFDHVGTTPEPTEETTTPEVTTTDMIWIHPIFRNPFIHSIVGKGEIRKVQTDREHVGTSHIPTEETTTTEATVLNIGNRPNFRNPVTSPASRSGMGTLSSKEEPSSIQKRLRSFWSNPVFPKKNDDSSSGEFSLFKSVDDANRSVFRALSDLLHL